jgi:formylglycine-generating enzyme required for sulfatase activity
VSWDDAKAYCRWLSKATSKSYRLPSEAEWVLCCLAGSKTGEYRDRSLSVESFQPNPWGLYQVHGNVWEWCEDQAAASSSVLFGGSWFSSAKSLRSAVRDDLPSDNRSNYVRFRVARTL